MKDVKRPVVRVEVSGQFKLSLNGDDSSDELSTPSETQKKQFVEPDPARTQIGLKDHLQGLGRGEVFIIDQLLREQDWSVFESGYAPGGRPAYAPRLMVGLILYGVLQGRSSLRELESMARDSLGCLWISGGIMPDHSIISRFICRHAELLSKGFFEGLTSSVLKHTGSSVERTAGDGTVVEAAASRYKTIKREALEKQIDKEKDRLENAYEQEQVDSKQVSQSEARLERLHETERQLSKREAIRKAKGKDPSRLQINPQEPDAVNQPLKQQGYGVSYKPSVIVNDHRVIVGHGVDASSETKVALNLLNQASRFGDLQESSWDAGYNNYSMLEQQAEYDVSLLIPQGRPESSDKKYKQYPKSHFQYDEATDTYLCPAGEILSAKSTQKGKNNEQSYTRYSTKACQQCEQRDRCTTSKRGRQINRYEKEHLREEMREKLKDESTQKRYHQRAGWVEPVFSELQLRQGLTRFHRKGKAGVSVEFALHSLAYNLSRAVAYAIAQKLLLLMYKEFKRLLAALEPFRALFILNDSNSPLKISSP